MKKAYTLMISAAVLFCTAFNAEAWHRCENGWKEKMMSEKIAFLTTELDITPDEAQAFWPVYNKLNDERDAAMHETFDAFRALEQAIEAGRPEKEVTGLLDRYLAAQKKQRELDNSAAEHYRKALPAGKVARLFVAEEKFRRQHIRRLHDKPGEKKQQ